MQQQLQIKCTFIHNYLVVFVHIFVYKSCYCPVKCENHTIRACFKSNSISTKKKDQDELHCYFHKSNCTATSIKRKMLPIFSQSKQGNKVRNHFDVEGNKVTATGFLPKTKPKTKNYVRQLQKLNQNSSRERKKSSSITYQRNLQREVEEDEDEKTLGAVRGDERKETLHLLLNQNWGFRIPLCVAASM